MNRRKFFGGLLGGLGSAVAVLCGRKPAKDNTVTQFSVTELLDGSHRIEVFKPVCTCHTGVYSDNPQCHVGYYVYTDRKGEFKWVDIPVKEVKPGFWKQVKHG